jgi:hypothetical protein
MCDILGKVVWYANGVPSDTDASFGPEYLDLTDEKTVVLLEIACRICGAKFLVAAGTDMKIDLEPSNPGQSFEESIRSMLATTGAIAIFDTGNPPQHKDKAGNSCPGNAINARTIGISQFWLIYPHGEWGRCTDYEIDFEDPKDSETSSE